MDVAILIGKIILMLVSIGVIVIVLMQAGKGDGLSGLTGGSGDTFFARNKNKTMEARLNRLTYIGGAVMIVLSIALVLMSRFSA